MAQRQDRDRERGRRHEPAGTPGIPEEGSPRPMWLKPPPRAKQPRLSWDQIIASAAARNTSSDAHAEPPPTETAAAAEAAPQAKRRRRRRGRRGKSAGAASPSADGEEAAAEEESGPGPNKAEAPPAATAGDGEHGPGRSRRRRGRRGSGARASAASDGAGAAVPPAPPPEDDRPVIAIGPPRQRRRRSDAPGHGRAQRAPGPRSAPTPLGPPAAPHAVSGASALDVAPAETPEGANALVRHHLIALRVHPPLPPATPTARAIRHLRGPRVPGAGEPLAPGKVRVIYRDGRELTPCERKKAEQEVTLGRAKWVGPTTIRLRYDPFRARRTRRRILERDEGVCAYCGALGDTIDHLTPWSLGGRTTMDNCVTSCAECNFRRGNRPVIDFVIQEGITLRRMQNPVLLEYVRAARAERRRTTRRRTRAQAAEAEQAEGS